MILEKDHAKRWTLAQIRKCAFVTQGGSEPLPAALSTARHKPSKEQIEEAVHVCVTCLTSTEIASLVVFKCADVEMDYWCDPRHHHVNDLVRMEMGLHRAGQAATLHVQQIHELLDGKEDA